jgi:hypothetical protein
MRPEIETYEEYKRKELIDRILDLSGDEFETKADYIELAKATDNDLFSILIKINNNELNK